MEPNKQIESWVRDNATQVTHHQLPDRKVNFGSFPGKSSTHSRGDAAARFNEIIAQLTSRNKTKLKRRAVDNDEELTTTTSLAGGSSGPVIYDNKELYAKYSFDDFHFEHHHHQHKRHKKNHSNGKLPTLSPDCQIL